MHFLVKRTFQIMLESPPFSPEVATIDFILGGGGLIFPPSENGSWLWLRPKRVVCAPPLRVWSQENWAVSSEKAGGVPTSFAPSSGSPPRPILLGWLERPAGNDSNELSLTGIVAVSLRTAPWL